MGRFQTCKSFKEVPLKNPTFRGQKVLRCEKYRSGPGTPPKGGSAIKGKRALVCRHPAGEIERVDCYSPSGYKAKKGTKAAATLKKAAGVRKGKATKAAAKRGSKAATRGRPPRIKVSVTRGKR